MKTILTTERFDLWLKKLGDKVAVARINARIRRIEATGNFGDAKLLGDGLLELRIHCRSGYRVYFINNGLEIIILLCGGNKSSQRKDIEKAKLMLKNFKELK